MICPEQYRAKVGGFQTKKLRGPGQTPEAPLVNITLEKKPGRKFSLIFSFSLSFFLLWMIESICKFLQAAKLPSCSTCYLPTSHPAFQMCILLVSDTSTTFADSLQRVLFIVTQFQDYFPKKQILMNQVNKTLNQSVVLILMFLSMVKTDITFKQIIVIGRKTRMTLHLLSTSIAIFCLYQMHKTYISVKASSASTGFFTSANVLRLQATTTLLQVVFIITTKEVSAPTASLPSTSVWRVLTSTIRLLACLALLLVLAGIEINPGPPTKTEEPETDVSALLTIMNKELEKLVHASDILRQFTKKGKISKGMVSS